MLSCIKLLCEIAAYLLGAIFLIGKLVDGEYNYAMSVELMLERMPIDSANDLVSVTVVLKRGDSGQIQLQDIRLSLIEWDGNEKKLGNEKKIDVEPQRILRHEINGTSICACYTKGGTYLPPKEGTQLAYCTAAAAGKPLIVDATVLARRTGIAAFFGQSQWRASAVSLPHVKAV